MYPSGYYLHLSFPEATLALVKQYAASLSTISAPSRKSAALEGHFGGPRHPGTGLEGKFSHQYGHVALAVLDTQKQPLKALTMKRALASDIQDFMRKVSVGFYPLLPKNPDFRYYPGKDPFARRKRSDCSTTATA